MSATAGHDAFLSPQYCVARGKWKPVPLKVPGVYVCGSNIMLSDAILPGGILEGEFTLLRLASGYYDVTKLEQGNQYMFRFTFYPSAGIASPNGSFCLTTSSEQLPPVVSREVVLQSGQD